jgi:hypothetical protein
MKLPSRKTCNNSVTFLCYDKILVIYKGANMPSSNNEAIDNSPEMSRARDAYFKAKREIYDLIGSGQNDLSDLDWTEVDILLQEPRTLRFFTKGLSPRQADNFMKEFAYRFGQGENDNTGVTSIQKQDDGKRVQINVSNGLQLNILDEGFAGKIITATRLRSDGTRELAGYYADPEVGPITREEACRRTSPVLLKLDDHTKEVIEQLRGLKGVRSSGEVDIEGRAGPAPSGCSKEGFCR